MIKILNSPSDEVTAQIMIGYTKAIDLAYHLLANPLPEITINFSDKMRTTAGRANYAQREILLNTRLLAKNNEHLMSTFFHEFAHIIQRHIYGYYGVKSHGPEWKQIMHQLGQEVKRCHNLDTTGLKRRWSRYPAKCNCTIHNITANRLKKMKLGVKIVCTLCKSQLILVSEVKTDEKLLS